MSERTLDTKDAASEADQMMASAILVLLMTGFAGEARTVAQGTSESFPEVSKSSY